MQEQLNLFQTVNEAQSPVLRVGDVTTSASVYDDFGWINNNNFVKDANKHTSCDLQLSKNEIWLDNTSGNDRWEKGVDIPKDYAHLKTIRLGEQAYCIKGKPLSRDFCLPLIIDKSEEQEYDRIYMKKMSAYAR
ncbi:MAG: hypothetical protein KBG11_10235 [Bacteroidia bacterium]|nr:hypothetical protein [Bacteroidia bacterium]